MIHRCGHDAAHACAKGSSDTRRKARAAFTIVEILVVVAIVVLLMGLLFPVIRMARERPRIAVCTSNLRQLHAAFTLYASDHDGLLPPYQNQVNTAYRANEGSPALSIPENGHRLVEVMTPYTKSRSLWFCPGDPDAGADSENGGIRHRFSSYRTSHWVGRETVTGEAATEEGPEVFLKRTDAASIVLLTDALWTCFSDNCPKPPYWHNGRFNYVFFDGHVKSIRYDPNALF